MPNRFRPLINKVATVKVPRGLLIVVGYVAAHYGLSLLSTNMEVARNISVWYLPAGLLFGSLMVARGPQVLCVVVGDIISRAIWAVGVSPSPIWLVVGLTISPTVYLAVTALLKSPRVAAGFQTSIGVTWLILGMVLAPAIAAPLNCVNYAAFGIFQYDQLGQIIPSFLIGDLVGIGTLVPLIMAIGSVMHEPPNGFGENSSWWPGGMALIRTALLPIIAALALFAVYESERPEIFTAGKFLMFIPLTVVALRDGWRGASVSIVILNFSIVLALAVHQVPVSAIDIQLLLLSYSIFALVMGVVTEERRDAQRLNELLATAVHSSPNPVGIIDMVRPDQRFLFVNNALIALSGQSSEELLRSSWRDLPLDAQDSDRIQIASELINNRNVVDLEVRLTKKDDDHRIIQVKGGPVFGNDGNCNAYTIAFLDVTLTKQRELIEREREKMISLGQLASGVAHELNNLIHPMMNYAKLADRVLTNDPERAHRYHEGILSLGKKAGEIVRKVLQFARPKTQTSEPICLVNAVVDAVDLTKTRIPPTVTLRFIVRSGSERLVRIEPTEVTQIISNLLINAVHAVPKGGAIDVTVDALSMGTNEVDALAAGGYLRIMVSDNGHGMTEETRRKVFDPFFSTKAIGEGTGLGLSVVFGIVAAVGGAITVESAEGKGATFSVYLPEVVTGRGD